jgi:peptidyl-prolyl cis-trans isomerase SurA
LAKYPDYIVEISGNSDTQESDTISAARARNVVAYLTKNNISMTRIIEKDNGKYKPLSKTSRELNSRVSFVFYSNSTQDLVKQYNTLRPESLQILEGYFRKGSNKYLEDLRWEVGKYMFEKDSRYCQVDITAVEPARKRTFDEAVLQVVKDLRLQIEKQWIAQLKKQYPVQLFEEELKKTIK